MDTHTQSLVDFNATMVGTTMDYSTIGLQPFNDHDVIVFAVFVFIFMVFGVAANLLTVAVIATSTKLRSIFHYFIFSLCLSDTASALISWINWYRRTSGFDDFKLGSFVCSFYWAVDIWTSCSTALHITSFAILRFVSLRLPHRMTSPPKGYPWGLIWISVIWGLTFACGAVPFFIISGVEAKNRSASNFDSKWPFCSQLNEWVDFYIIYTRITYPLFFFIPIFFTTILSCVIMVIMMRYRKNIKTHLARTSSKARKEKDRKAVLQMLLIVASFMIGYIPFTAYEFYTLQKHHDSFDNWQIDWRFGTAQYMCLRLSECLNPIFYNVGSKTMWNETKKFLANKCCLSRKAQNFQPSFSSVSAVVVRYDKN